MLAIFCVSSDDNIVDMYSHHFSVCVKVCYYLGFFFRGGKLLGKYFWRFEWGDA